MSNRIDSVEIFSIGRWKGSKTVEVTSDDLDQMVHSFNSLNSVVQGFRPPLKLGHAEEQKFMDQKGGHPALGWVERIWREGEKILANFVDLPDELIDLVKKRRYNNVSIEMYPEIEYEGNTFRNVLSAVALLGAELPAVKNLKELSASLFDDLNAERLTFTELDNMATFTQEQHESLLAAALAQARATFASEHKDEVAVKDSAISALKAENEKLTGIVKQANEELAKFQAEVADREIDAVIEQAIKDGKALPAQREYFKTFARALDAKVKFGDKELSPAEALKDFFAASKAVVDFKEKGAGGKASEGGDPGSVFVEVDERVKERMSKDKDLKYSDAMRLVLSEDAELASRYVKGV